MALHSMRVHGRVVEIYVPPGYDPSRSVRYPLLVLHDGQNLFNPETSHAGQTWEIAPTLDRLITAGVLAPIVVAGIAHGGEDRITEFTPTANGGRGGHALEYADFVVYDVLPQLATALHVRTDFEGLALGGSSLGGLVTLYIASQFPGRFGHLLVMSPSVWWDRRAILRLLQQRPFRPSPRVWLDIGLKEGRSTVLDTRALHKLLREQQITVQYVEDLSGDHSERCWAQRFDSAIRWLWSSAPAGASGGVLSAPQASLEHFARRTDGQ